MLHITLISSLFNCDVYIDNYLNTLSTLNNIENNFLIIWNVFDSNKYETNNKINNFVKGKEYITLINVNKKDDTGLYDSWNKMLEMVKTDLVCNYNADDKLHPDFLNVYIREFEKDKNLNLLCCPLFVSKNLKDNFNDQSQFDTLYFKKKILLEMKILI
jgi:cellulose synthase/poly-beta-1,6-N-acetylglucosamine synthase-like glycosyltransferase